MTNMTNGKVAWISAAGFVLSVAGWMIVISLTSPSSAGPLGLLAVLGLIYLTCWSLAVLIGLLVLITAKASYTKRASLVKSTPDMPLKKMIAISAVVAAAPLLAISFNSINRIGILELGLIIMVEAAAIFYVTRQMNTK